MFSRNLNVITQEPLAQFMWDKQLIRTIFGYDYRWEIYIPPEKRKYGPYVLPLLYGEKFIGRVESICDRKNETSVMNVWYDDGVKPTKKLEAAVISCLKKFSLFNDCELGEINTIMSKTEKL